MLSLMKGLLWYWHKILPTGLTSRKTQYILNGST